MLLSTPYKWFENCHIVTWKVFDNIYIIPQCILKLLVYGSQFQIDPQNHMLFVKYQRNLSLTCSLFLLCLMRIRYCYLISFFILFLLCCSSILFWHVSYISIISFYIYDIHWLVLSCKRKNKK